MDLDAALKTYIAESRELLQEMEDGLLGLEQHDNAHEQLHAIFRAAHTIKGSAGLFGLDEIVSFTHHVETLLDRLREHPELVDEETTALLLECRDYVAQLIDRVEAGEKKSSPDDAQQGLISRLERACGAGTASQADLEVRSQAFDRMPTGGHVESDDWHISLRFGPDSFRDGMDPLSFLRYLNTLGTIVTTTPVTDALPSTTDFDPECCYLGFEIRFRSDAEKAVIENVFEFVRDSSAIHIIPPRSRIGDYIELIGKLPEEDLRLGEMLVRCGSLTEAELAQALQLQEQMRADAIDQPLGNIVVERGMTPELVVDAAIEKQAKVRETKFNDSHTIRVDAAKLDNLINLIGELVIAGAGTALGAQTTNDGALVESVSEVTRLIEEVRDSALRLRMVQIGATFNRFQRVVRDVSKELDKEIELVITGAETELDKSVVEKIGDPLMHLVRNAIDHGIESPEVRRHKGKSERGTVRLNAYHESGSIVIEISDDGAGLNRDRILEKANSKGLIDAEQQLDDHDVYNLIFEPGFSTAESVTNLSGRGVGMDVVKRNITALRGSVELESEPGDGTTCRVRLPLTLAIIDGFLVEVEQSSFVVPLDMVLECVELTETSREMDLDGDYINLRGEVLPFIRLRRLFALGGQPGRRQNLVVVQYAGVKAGLLVDRLKGEFQTVIKPMGRIFSHVQGIGGSTILGNGEVALILDVPGLVAQVTARESKAGTVVI